MCRFLPIHLMTGMLFSLILWINGCASKDIVIQIKGGVPSDQLLYYTDPFDVPKRDLWEFAAFSQKDQLWDFEKADIKYENGRLKIQTRIGAFSSGVVASKFILSGDFDIQIDCQMIFPKGNVSVDHLLYFTVIRQGDTFYSGHSATLVIAKVNESKSGVIRAIQRRHGSYNRGNYREINRFYGTLRMMRTANHLNMYYRKQNASGWTQLDTLTFVGDNVSVIFGVQNFKVGRQALTATESVTGQFDNFRINAVSKVIESEI